MLERGVGGEDVCAGLVGRGGFGTRGWGGGGEGAEAAVGHAWSGGVGGEGEGLGGGVIGGGGARGRLRGQRVCYREGAGMMISWWQRVWGQC